MDRRHFVRLLLATLAGGSVAACGRELGGASVPGVSVGPTPLADATLRARRVYNENRFDRNVRYYQPFVPPLPDDWRLTVSGLVRTPMTLTLSDAQQLPVVEQSSRMVCVEGWSWKADWTGFAFADLMERVSPMDAARFVRLECADGYWEILSLDELLQPRVVFPYRMEGELLKAEYGSPLRLIVPWKYGYKGPKCVTKVSFVDRTGPGYWSTVGPYTADGAIEVGYDTPQETGQRVRIVTPGLEQTY